MNSTDKAAFFDGIADRWDGWEDLDALAGRLDAGLDALRIRPDETVLDVGCGTGNLTLALLRHLSTSGRVVAIDLAPRMIAVARGKIRDARVAWRVGDVRDAAFGERAFDTVLCCSVWPHFDDPEATAESLHRALRPGGSLHVWHPLPRRRVNEIHAGAGPAVARDVLPPAAEVAALLARCGFDVRALVDDDERFLVSAGRRAP
jgi:demethylmenaquinone methyltransferase/2-methoxy-6-polyprenyl-1,4-benzoquinol methylase